LVSHYALNFFRPSLTTKFNTREKLIDFGEVLIIFAWIPRSFSTLLESNTTVILSPILRIRGFPIKTRHQNPVRCEDMILKYTSKIDFFKAFYNLKILVHLLMIISTGSLWFPQNWWILPNYEALLT